MEGIARGHHASPSVALLFILGAWACGGSGPPRSAAAPPAAAAASAKATPTPVQHPATAPSLPELWPPTMQTGALRAPEHYVLPKTPGVVDIAVDRAGRIWVLGDSGTLDRIEGTTVSRVGDQACAPPRPKDYDPELPWPHMRHDSHGLQAMDDGVYVLMSSPGATASFFYGARVDAKGRWQCDLPPFLVGGAISGALHSGGELWVYQYGKVNPAFPDRRTSPPKLPFASGGAGRWVSVGLPGSPPGYYDSDRNVLHRFNGIRWEPVSLVLLPDTSVMFPITDRTGALWYTESKGSQQLVLYNDGSGWRASSPPDIELRSIVPRDRDDVWIVGRTKVAKVERGRYAVASHHLDTSGHAVDGSGRLWVWGKAKDRSANRDAPLELMGFSPEVGQ